MADSSPPLRKNMPTADYSPTPGCIIFVIGGVAIVTLVLWFLYAGWKQAKEITTFTDEAPVKLELVAATDPELAAIHSRLQDYAGKIAAKQPAELILTKADLNSLLATDKTLESIRNTMMIDSIGSTIVSKVSFPMNGLGGKRYLNGTIEFTPIIKPSTGIAIQTDQISVPGKTVSEGFVDLYKRMNFLDDMLVKAFREHPDMGPPFKSTTHVTLKEATVVLKYVPNS